MHMHRLVVAFTVALAGATVLAQEQADPKTLIPGPTLNAIAQHISGAQARNHVLEMCPYERNRPAEEYASGTYRESAYAEKMAKEYGFSDVHIERFPLGAKQWDGEMGELWMTEPAPAQLITRYRDIATTLAKWADEWAGAREAGMDVLATNFIDQIIELAQAARDA